MTDWTAEAFKRYLDRKEPDWEEAVIMMVDALRAYISIDKLMAKDFLDEGQITRELYDQEMAEIADMQRLLDRMEATELDCNLHGLIKVER